VAKDCFSDLLGGNLSHLFLFFERSYEMTNVTQRGNALPEIKRRKRKVFGEHGSKNISYKRLSANTS